MSRGESAKTAERTAAHNYEGARPAQIAEIQRARLLTAAVEVAGELGAAGASVADIVGRAGVSRRTFYELFGDREDCYLAAFEQRLGLLRDRVGQAYRPEDPWRERIRAALVVSLVFLDEQPLLACFLVLGSQGAGARVAERRASALAQAIAAIDQGRECSRADHLSALSAEAAVGGVLTVLQSRLLDPEHAPLIELTNPLMHMIVLPYLGAAAARRELERPVPPAPSLPVAPLLAPDPFRDANMRLTYRTVTVLSAIAENPGGSNRTIGNAADITDQGQISKLLARLQRKGMIENLGETPSRGGPNAWILTESGRRAMASIRRDRDGRGYQ